MYHCATQPILLHTSAGMMGMMVVKPRNLAPVDRELWLTQEEFYLGKPGKPADMAKMAAGTADAFAFNGYANQYKAEPITVRRGEKIRMYVLDAGPSKWSAFHVIGTVFDRTVVEGTVGRDSQTINLAPSQGGWVEFTLDEEGNYPFVTHAFGDMVKGAAGILHTTGAPKVAGGRARRARRRTAARPRRPTSTPRSATCGSRPTRPRSRPARSRSRSPTPAPPRTAWRSPRRRPRWRAACSTRAPSSPRARTSRPAPPARSTADLKPGKYELVCYLPGHYMAGQKLALRGQVTP